jgi:hypothetical protein
VVLCGRENYFKEMIEEHANDDPAKNFWQDLALKWWDKAVYA